MSAAGTSRAGRTGAGGDDSGRQRTVGETDAGQAGRARLRIGVLGAAGQIGRCLVRAVGSAADLELGFAVDRSVLDLARLEAIEPWLAQRGERPADLVINAAAFTKVDACERERELAHRMNAEMPGAWATALARRDVRFLQLSTDYVFPSDGRRPYRENDPTGPASVYGASKRAGEERVAAADPTALVVRTSWVFGPGRNFVVAILDQAAKRRRGEASGPLSVVDDQTGSPTSANDLAAALLDVARRMRPGAAESASEARLETPSGYLHLCNAGVTTWFGFARAILDQAGHGELELEPVATGVFPTAAPRPAYSVLDTSRAVALGISMRPWTEALAGYLAGPDRPTHLLPERPANAVSEPDRRKVSL